MGELLRVTAGDGEFTVVMDKQGELVVDSPRGALGEDAGTQKRVIFVLAQELHAARAERDEVRKAHITMSYGPSKSELEAQIAVLIERLDKLSMHVLEDDVEHVVTCHGDPAVGYRRLYTLVREAVSILTMTPDEDQEPPYTMPWVTAARELLAKVARVDELESKMSAMREVVKLMDSLR